MEEVRLDDGVTPIEFFRALPDFHVLVSRGAKAFVAPDNANDALMKLLARKGVFEHWVRYCSDGGLTEEGLLDFCLGDYPLNERYRHLHVENASVSPRFIQKIVEVSRWLTTIVGNS